MVKITLFIVLALGLLLIPAGSFCDNGSRDLEELIVFYSPACHRCLEVENNILPLIEKEFKGRIRIERRDITQIENYKFLLSLKQKYKEESKINVPLFFFKGEFLEAKSGLESRLRGFLNKYLGKEHRQQGILPQVDLIRHFNAFNPLIIVGSGLIDGINPCAFTVIVFFISFLALQGYRKRELAVIGLVFIFAVFLAYFLIGLGFFSFLYRMKGFWFFSRIFNLAVGSFSIIMGICALYDFFKFKKTGETEGLLLQLPAAIKNQIHRVIGTHYRSRQSAGISGLVSSALITGFLVSILEAVCTGQAYLPTITFVLKASSLKLEAFGYLLLYNLMFIMPLLAILFSALWGISSAQFSGLLKKNFLSIKLLLAVLFLGLGIFLVWRG
jgi:hypothetical protein